MDISNIIDSGLHVPWWKTETVITQVDSIARIEPHKIYAAYPRSSLSYEHGFREITYQELANGTNGIAELLIAQLGKGSRQETLAYIGPNDIRFVLLILGAAKAGYKILLVSPRNSVAAQFHLFEATQCRTILSPSPQPPQTTTILAAGEMRCIQIPSADELLDTPHPEHSYSKTLVQARADEFFVVHTSGSTGMPKPLVWNHQFVSTNIEHMQLDPPTGYQSQDRMIQGNRVFITFPPYHGAFLASFLFNAIPHGTIMIAPMSGAITTGQGLVEALQCTRIDVAFLIPSIANEIAQSARFLNLVAQSCQKIFYCGGDLPQEIGDKIVAKIPLYNQYGASEMGLTPQIWGHRTAADWKFIEPHPKIGAEMHFVANHLYEYTIVRQPMGQEQPAVFSIFPNISTYASRDLYQRHSSNPNLWSWKARQDDIIVFLNGEKTNPNSMEQYIATRNPDVLRVLVTGSQRFQASLIVQPMDNGNLDPIERAGFIERLWPSIEEANKVCPAFAKIAKSHVLFTTADKGMMISGKGTIQRAGTVALYEKELDRLYSDADDASIIDQSLSKPLVDWDNVGSIENTITQSLLSRGMPADTQSHDNFFSLGMDSLQALQLLRDLRSSFGLPALALSTIYTNPTILSLAQAVLHENSRSSSSENHEKHVAVNQIENMLEKYKLEVGAIKCSIDQEITPEPGDGKHIGMILTGSTGALGCHLLQSCLSNANVVSVHCLNRGQDGGRALQAKRLLRRGLDPRLADDPRLQFHEVDLGTKDLGLSTATLNAVRKQATHVIHAAWLVDFNLPLSAFEPHISGIINILSLAAASVSRVRFMFISSISSMLGGHISSGSIAESASFDLTAPGTTGYAQSKFIGEALLAKASQTPGVADKLSLAFARVGQLAGAIDAPTSNNSMVTWNAAEWFPSLVLSSMHIGALPDSLGQMSRIDWVPIDALASILTELVLLPPGHRGTAEAGNIDVYHPHNLHHAKWQVLRRAVVDEISSYTGRNLELVSPRDWLDRVQKRLEADAGAKGIGKAKAIRDEDMAQLLKSNPAVKLLDWYEDALTRNSQSPIFDTGKTSYESATLRTIPMVQGSWMKKWIKEWADHVRYVKYV